MVKCPDCGEECTEDYNNAEIISCQPGHIVIRYTRLIRCPTHGLFEQENQRKDVTLP